MASLDTDEDSSDASKARAIGRKRNGYGEALGDVVLPEGKTASGLVESALATGFQEAGYLVVKQGAPNFGAAAPVTARIIDFWAWFQPGFWSITTNQKSELQLSGDVGALHGAQTVKTSVSESKQVVVSSDWQEIVEKGLWAITLRTKELVAGNSYLQERATSPVVKMTGASGSPAHSRSRCLDGSVALEDSLLGPNPRTRKFDVEVV